MRGPGKAQFISESSITLPSCFIEEIDRLPGKKYSRIRKLLLSHNKIRSLGNLE